MIVSTNSAAPLVRFRWLVVAAQAATLAITWPLWQVRDDPPLLPAVDWPQFDTGWLLAASLAVVVARPALGLALHTSLLVVAMLLDQTRMQPEVMSLAVLMWGTLPSGAARTIARTHLISMWFYAGLHKLINPDYYPRIADLLGAELSWFPGGETGRVIGWGFAALIAAGEMSLAVLSLAPRTRRLAAALIAVLHGSIPLLLLFFEQHSNESIWPWNVALAASGFVLIAPWRESPRETFRAASWPLRSAVLALWVYPAGFYVGLVDSYPAHCLYSYNTAWAWLITSDADPRQSVNMLPFETLRVPLPPEHRLFEAYWRIRVERKSNRPGEFMLIDDRRVWARRDNLHDRRLTPEGEYRANQKHGPWTYRFSSGRKELEGHYVAGQEEGLWTEWHPNGQKKSEGQFRAGVVSGQWTFWEEDGTQRTK